MTTTQITVTGMTCDHCVRSVSEELSELAGVQDRSVALDHAALLEPADPLLSGGRGQPGLLADVGVRHPAVPREKRKYATVELFHGGHRASIQLWAHPG